LATAHAYDVAPGENKERAEQHYCTDDTEGASQLSQAGFGEQQVACLAAELQPRLSTKERS